MPSPPPPLTSKPPPMLPTSPKRAPGAPSAPPPQGPTRERKTFTVKPWTGEGQGEKVVVYGGSGAGKTTLMSMMPTAIFLGLDDGGRKIADPRTGEPIKHVEGVFSFQDVRDALNSPTLWPKGSSCIIDTFTVLENLAEPFMFETIPHEKGGRVTNLEGYGYGKGYTHLYDTMRLVLQDLDGLIRQGVNVGLICQSATIKAANAAGADYLYEGPKLCHPFSEKCSVRLHVCEWADHVAKIDWLDDTVEAEKKKAGKRTGNMDRAVFILPKQHFFAKSRTRHEPIIAFNAPDDDSLWRFLFPGEYK